MLKALIVYVHLLATAFALVELLKFDFQMLRKLNQPLSIAARKQLRRVRVTISLALAVLWVTGIGLVVSSALVAPDSTWANEKLWMKVITVLLLTLNGILVHRVASRWLAPGLVVSEMPPLQQQLLLVMGTVSTVSWLFAAFLGIARTWDNTARIEELLALYGTLLIGAIVVLNVLLAARPARNASKNAVEVETRHPS